MPDTDPDAPTLPGLDDTQQPGQLTAMERAVRDTLDELHTQGKLDRRHAAHMQLALELSASVSRTRGADYGRAQLVAQLVAVMDRLMPPEQEGGQLGDFDKWRAYLDGVADAGGSATVGDPS